MAHRTTSPSKSPVLPCQLQGSLDASMPLPTTPYLMTLPSEIRLRILEEVLLEEPNNPTLWVPGWLPETIRLYRALLRTCRKFYHEGTTILYGKTLFSFGTECSSLRHEVERFSTSIRDNVAYVRRVEIHKTDLYEQSRRTLLLPELLALLPNLREIIIRSHQYGTV